MRCMRWIGALTANALPLEGRTATSKCGDVNDIVNATAGVGESTDAGIDADA